jgi:uncharacterized protein (TIGR03435 family)
MMRAIALRVVLCGIVIPVLLAPAAGGKEFRFEVVSMRPMNFGMGVTVNMAPSPNGFDSHLSLWQAIILAYTSEDITSWGSVEVRGAPKWIGDFYDIRARVARGDLKAWQGQGEDHELLRSALRAVLRERCRLAIHEEPSKARVWELVVKKGGMRLKASDPNAVPPEGVQRRSGAVWVMKEENGKQVENFYRAGMQDLVDFLNIITGGRPPVRDRTGLPGRYDFTFREVALLPGDDHVYRYPVGHLGLQVRAGVENRPVLVIDHIEKPTPN